MRLDPMPDNLPPDEAAKFLASSHSTSSPKAKEHRRDEGNPSRGETSNALARLKNPMWIPKACFREPRLWIYDATEQRLIPS